MAYHNGQYMTDKMMQQYVDFILSLVGATAGASVSAKDGFPMKGHYVPVTLEVLKKERTYVDFKLTSLGFSKELTLFLSRKKSPADTLAELQEKIDITVNQIVTENNLDKEEIWKTNHPLRFLKLK